MLKSLGNYRFFTEVMALLAVVIFGIGNYFIDLSEFSRHLWADAWWTLVSLAAGLKCYTVARRLDNHLNLAWKFFGHACISWFVGMLIWSYLELVEKTATPFPAWSDLGYLLFAPLFMVGVINFHSVLPNLPFRLLQVSKLGIILCCIAIILSVIFYESIRDLNQPILYLVTALAYPVMYVSLFFLSLINIGFYVWKKLRYVSLMLLLSIFVFAVSDTLYALVLLKEDYQVGNILDIFWVIGFVLMYLAAEKQQENDRYAENKDSRPLFQFSSLEDLFVPSTLFFTLVVLFMYREGLDSEVGYYIFLLGLVLTIFLAARELAGKRVNDVLIDTLQKSEAEYKGIIDNMHDTFYRTNATGVLEIVSPSVSTLLGYTPDELIGTRLANLYAEPDGREKFQKSILTSGGVARDFEAALLRKDKSIVWVSTNARYLRDKNGEVLGIEGTTRDITERKGGQDRLWKAHQELERRVNERTADLERARVMAEKASEAKSEFLSRMSHELRTPLNAILGFAQLMEVDNSISSEDQKGNIKEILSSGYHLLELISDILDLSQIEAGSLQLNREDVEVGPVVKQCLAMVRPIADVNKVSLVEVPSLEKLPKVYCDVTRLKQALINLLSNAVKYNRQHGTVTVSCKKADNDMLRINIIDTGPGIPADKLDMLFQPFERLGAERTTVEGTGIGLTISRRLIEMMDGKLGLESTTAIGSHFYIELPIVT